MEHHTAKSKQKGGAFKLHSHPTDFFDDNPYYSKSGMPIFTAACLTISSETRLVTIMKDIQVVT